MKLRVYPIESFKLNDRRFSGMSIRRRSNRSLSATVLIMVAVVVLAAPQSVFAGIVITSSVQDGHWNDPATWDSGLPFAGNSSSARIGHDVTAPDANQVGHEVFVGYAAGDGTLTIPSGDLEVFRMAVGNAGGQGILELSGGALDTDVLVIGRSSPGTMHVSDGQLDVGFLFEMGIDNEASVLNIAGPNANLTVGSGPSNPAIVNIGADATVVIAPTANGLAGLSPIDCQFNGSIVFFTGSTLELDVSSYVPDLNDSWTVLTGTAAIAGSFSSLVSPPGFVLEQDLSVPGELTIRVIETPCSILGDSDSDNDGVCDLIDACPGFDDQLDADGDSVPDDCDVCPGFDDAVDTDGDGAPDGCDACDGPAPCSGSIAVDWDSSVNGVTTGAMCTTSVTIGPGMSSPIPRDYSSANYAGVPFTPTLQTRLGYAAATEWTATFDPPVTDLLLYVGNWRNASDAGGPNPIHYTFDHPFGIVSGLSNVSVSPTGDTLIGFNGSGLHSGILKFPGPIASLSLTTSATSTGAAISLTFGAILPGPDADGDGVPDDCDTCAGGAGSADVDGDGDVDGDDYAQFATCLAGPDAGFGAGCECFDFDADDDVDLMDIMNYQASFTGP